jgi:predicted MFS family arabinose efflux permease
VVFLGLTAVSPWRVATAVLLFMCGFMGILCMTAATTQLQLQVPGHLRGRVMGIYILLFIGLTPIGSYLCGLLAEHTGIRSTVLMMAGLCGAGVIAGWVYARRKVARPVVSLENQAETA